MHRAHTTVGSLASLSACVVASLLLAGPAHASSEQARLSVHFTPYELGKPTTVAFSVSIAAHGGTPSPLQTLDLRMAAGLELTTSTLGQATCSAETLKASGPSACPSNSLLGFGSGSIEVPFEAGLIDEPIQVDALLGQTVNEQISVLLYASGEKPVVAHLVFPGEVVGDSGPFGDRIDTVLPPVEAVPGGPDVALTALSTTIGPLHLTYYRHEHGRTVAFHPRGIALPRRCPPGGFRFAGVFSFQDGTQAQSATAVPCPRHTRKKRKARRRRHG